MYYVGFDIHSKFIYATVLDEAGSVINQGSIPTTQKGIDDFLGFLPNKQVKIVIESCGIWEDIYDLLTEKGYHVVLANPLKVKAIAYARIKNDKVDSETLAKLLKADLVPTSYVPKKEVRQLRAKVRHRKVLVRQRTRLKNAIQSILRRKNIKKPYTDVFTAKGIAFLKAVSDPRINSFLTLYNATEAEIKAADKDLSTDHTLHKEVNLVQTVPGIGKYSAQVICAEIGTITRFGTPQKLCSYAGIIPSQNQSGEKDFKGRITKQGSRDLRWILVQCAHITISIPGKLQTQYYRHAKRMPKCKAVVALAKKMLIIIWHMLQNQEPFRT